MEPKNFEQKPSNPEVFVFPNIKEEVGEIERVAQLYAPGNERDFMENFLEASKAEQLVDLTEDLWSKLENTDSYDIKSGDWGKVEEHINFSNTENDYNRDWNDLKQKIEQGQRIDAPIILKYDDTFHLVSGNTRLMVSRALGKTPKVLIVEMKSEQNVENREKFFKRLEGKFSPEEIEDIDFAYDIAKEAHRPATRDEGMR